MSTNDDIKFIKQFEKLEKISVTIEVKIKGYFDTKKIFGEVESYDLVQLMNLLK